MGDLIELAFAVLAVILGFIFGRRAEKRHYESIGAREVELLPLSVRVDPNFSNDASDATLVMGSVVIASDRFKALVGSLQGFFGGRVTSAEPLMDRARREAILRLKAKAKAWGAREIVNLRVDTSMLDKQGVEVFASATAVK